MAYLYFKNIDIQGIAACVPHNVLSNREFNSLLSLHELEKTVKTTGIAHRRVAENHHCTSDFCCMAANKLMQELDVDKKTIDVLIFVTQTPDYRIPATATVLQHKLGLAKTVAAFDINLGCTGYVYGLATAFLYASHPTINKVLLLVGDTVTKFVNKMDRSSALLFGDGGSATIIDKKEETPAGFFSLNTDGAGEGVIKIKAGGYRFPSSIETLSEKTDDNGNTRNDEQLYMNGTDVFNFAINEVPKDILGLIAYAGITLDQVDYIVYHQANKFMNDYLTKKLKFPQDKVPYSLDRFGNTSSLSIPLTIVTELKEKLKNTKQIILSGFGVGLSWSTALLNLSQCHMCDLIEI
jgi:3-oxoacyl-[acyl-carrier-protein] synthase-3